MQSPNWMIAILEKTSPCSIDGTRKQQIVRAGGRSRIVYSRRELQESQVLEILHIILMGFGL